MSEPHKGKNLRNNFYSNKNGNYNNNNARNFDDYNHNEIRRSREDLRANERSKITTTEKMETNNPPSQVITTPAPVQPSNMPLSPVPKDESSLDDFLIGLDSTSYGRSQTKNATKGITPRRGAESVFKYSGDDNKKVIPVEMGTPVKMLNKAGRYDSKAHMFFGVPDRSQYFCTHCMGTISDGVDKHEHRKKCGIQDGVQVDTANWCMICNSKCSTINEAKAHYNGTNHSTRRMFIKSFLQSGGKYYITDKSCSTQQPTNFDFTNNNVVDYCVVLDFTELCEKRLKQSDDNYQKFQKTPSEQLATLLSQLMEQKKTSKGVQVDLVAKNKLNSILNGLLSEINSGIVHCHLVNDEDFISPANILEAIFLILQNGVSSSTDETTKSKKMLQLDELFTVQNGDNVHCCVCNKLHQLRTYKNRKSLYAAINAIKSQTI